MKAYANGLLTTSAVDATNSFTDGGTGAGEDQRDLDRVSRSGNGFPIVFLHAFPLSRMMWAPQEAALAQDFRIVTLDLRGHGESDAPLWHYTLEEAADDVRGLLDP